MKNQHNYFIFGRDLQFELNSDFATDDYDLLVNACGVDYYTDLIKNYEMFRKNGRKDWLLLYIENGECNFKHNDIANHVDSGSVILFKPYETQYYSYPMDKKTKVLWVHFTGSKALNILEECGLNKPFAKLCFKPARLESAINSIISEFKRPTKHYREICASTLKIFLYTLGDALTNTESIPINEKLKEIAQEMQITYDQNLSIDYFAERYGCSLGQFIIIFKEAFGCTPRNFIMKQRLTTAENLLIDSNFSIKKIAKSVGYEDSLYFSRIFKKKYGYSPNKYKKLYSIKKP